MLIEVMLQYFLQESEAEDDVFNLHEDSDSQLARVIPCMHALLHFLLTMQCSCT